MGKPSRRKISKHLGVIVQHIKAHVPADVGLEVFVFHKLALIGDTKPELAIDHRATGQGLSCDNLSSGATRRVGRRAVAVVERHQGLLDLVLAALVDRLMRALGTTGDGRRGSERTGGVVGDGDRHGAHGVIVGVTGLVVVLLGHGVLEGLAGVSLRKCNLMTSQDVDQADCCLCRCRRLEVVGSGQQTERASRRVVSGCHGKGELALGHGAAVQILAEPQTAGRDVIELSAVLVSKASVFLLGDVGFQVALAVLGHGHFGGRDMSIIRHADRATRVLADLVLVGSGSRVVNLAELDGSDAVLRIVLVHGHGCGIGQRGAVRRSDGKAELVPIRPVAAVDGLAQVKVEVCIGRGHAVGVLEGRRLVALQLVRSAEGAVAVVGNGGLDGELGVTVGDALAGGSAVDLAQRVGMLAGLVVGDLVHGDRAIGGIGAPGDDLVALDQLEGELAGGKRAPGQGLGRGDLVGDAELVRRHVIGISEREGRVAVRLAGHAQIALAVIGHGEGNLARRLGVVGHASDLAGLGHGVGKGVLALLGLLAQSLVKAVERKGDLAKVDLAVGAVVHARVHGHGCTLFAGHGKGELAGDVSRGQAVDGLQVLDTHKRCLGGIRGVSVLELDALGILGTLHLVRGNQLALAVIADGRHDGVDRFVVGNTTGVTLDLVQLVGVLTDLSVLDSAERHLAVGIVLDGLDRLIFLVHDFEQLKAELAGRKIAPGQGLGHVNLVGNAGLNRLRSVNVLELVLACFAPSHLHVSAELALLVGRHRHGDLRDVLAVGNAVNRGPSVLLADLVDIRSRCGVFDRTEVNGRLALVIQIVLGHGRKHGRSRGLGHRGVALGRQPKLKLVLLRPVAALEHLGQAKVGLGIHRCRRHVVLIADLAVVAQVGVDMRRARLGGHVVPLGIEHVGGGTGVVAAHALLGGMKLVDKGQARGSDTKRQAAALLVSNNSAVELRSIAALECDDIGRRLDLAVLTLLLKLILIVIGGVIIQRARCWLRAALIRVNRSLLLEVVVAVGVGRLKGRNRISQLPAVPLVRVEIHGLGAVDDGRIMLDVVLEPRDLLGRKQIVECSALHARGVLHADRLSAVDRKLAVYGLKVALRNQRCGDADRYNIALSGIFIAGTLHGDEQVFCLAGELVRVGIGFFVGRLARLGKRRAVDDGFGKTVDLHKIAQLIGKRNIAVLVRVVTRRDFGRMRCFRRNGL